MTRRPNGTAGANPSAMGTLSSAMKPNTAVTGANPNLSAMGALSSAMKPNAAATGANP